MGDGSVTKARLLGIAALLILSGAGASQASSLVDLGNNTYDPNTGLQWLDVSLTNGRAYSDVFANLNNPSDAVYGYRYATGAEVSQLFVDAGINGPCGGCDLFAIQNLISLLGPTFAPPNYEYTEGFTADVISSSYQTYALLQVEYPSSAFVNPSAGYLISYLPQQRVGNFLVLDVGTTPLPATLPLFASGLGALGLLGWRRKRKAQAAA
jgi:hypothetical protein